MYFIYIVDVSFHSHYSAKKRTIYFKHGTMEVVRQMRKGSSIDNERSPQKKIKLESDDRMKEEEDEHGTPGEFSNPVPWKKIEAEGLDCDYAQLFSKNEADYLFQKLEEEVVYLTGTKSSFVLTGDEAGIE